MVRGRRGGKQSRRGSLVLLCLVLAWQLLGCARGERHAPSRAFYYWRTTFELSPSERRALGELHVDKLYLRAFDVAPGSANTPTFVGVVQKAPEQALPPGVVLVPVVFFKNQVFASGRLGSERALAERVWKEVTTVGKALGATSLNELQVDCDWTDSTRARFFEFVRALRQVSGPGTRLSATIRLHQVKYRERTGVPPVDSGMLMFYNMGRFSADPLERSIFDAEAAERYLDRLDDYPLPLDAALPIWSWTLQLREQEVVGLLQSTDPAELPALDFVKEEPPLGFEVTRTTFLHGSLLRQGDVLKGETLNASDLQKATDLLARNLAPASKRRTVALFDLSERNLSRHGLRTLEQAFQVVR
ncbi:MAG TPA: hypothetical protein VHP33_10720 [Polyangiaceae bacterium]|nr:hypothetical protein [Polyangiaceae bacterium]